MTQSKTSLRVEVYTFRPGRDGHLHDVSASPPQIAAHYRLLAQPTMATTNGAAKSVAVAGPPLAMIVREKTRAYLTPFPYDAATAGSDPAVELPESREDPVFSADGAYMVAVETADACVVVRRAIDGSEVARFGGLADSETPLKVNFVTFSPLGTHVLAWARSANSTAAPNLVVYKTVSGEKLAAFHQKTFNQDFWPTVQWSDDESFAARMVSNTIQFFDGSNVGGGVASKLHLPGVTSFALSQGSAPSTVASFTAGKSGAPGRIAVFQHPAEGGEQILERSTFRADAVTFKWSATGTALLALVSTNVDATGKSYYGESEVYFCDIAKKSIKRMELPQEGPTYDVAWSPSGNEFIIIYGFMPARATMFNSKCEPLFDFGTGARNTVSFSPHGRFVALAGFGSLAGTVQFWDKNKTTLVGTAEIPCTTAHCWSPCSRYFLGATTFPRLRVDNGVRIVRFDGQLIHHHKVGSDQFLLQATFKPALRSAYQDPKISADLMIGGPPIEPGAAGSGAMGIISELSATNGAPRKPTGVYRPPGARGTEASFSLHQVVEAGKVNKVTFATGTSLSVVEAHRTMALRSTTKIIPGLEVEEPKGTNAMSKAQIKRQKKKEKEARQAAGISTALIAANSNDAPPAPEDLTTVEAAAKRIKGLNKRLRQIEALIVSVAEGKEMNPEQVEKLKSEASTREDLLAVECRMEALSK
jgi:translation initiation factor 2A